MTFKRERMPWTYLQRGLVHVVSREIDGTKGSMKLIKYKSWCGARMTVDDLPVAKRLPIPPTCMHCIARPLDDVIEGE